MATWTDPTGATVSIYSVDGSAGIMTLDNVDPEGTQVLIGTDVRECEVTFAMDWITGSAGIMTPGVYYRSAADLSTFFKVTFTVDLDFLTNDTITAITVSDETGTIGSATVSKAHTIGVPFNVKVRSTQNHFVKVWSANQSEPADWDLTTGTGSTASGTVGLTAAVALDAPVPASLTDVLWLFGAEQGITGFGTSVVSGIAPLISSSSSNVRISAAGAGQDGVGYAARFQVTASNGFILLNTDPPIPSNLSTFTTSFAVRFNGSLPTGGFSNLITLFQCDIVGLTGFNMVFRATDSTICLQTTNNLTTVVVGPVVTTNTWYQVELTADLTTSTFAFQWSVNGVAQTNGSRAGVASPPRLVQQVYYGPAFNTTTGDMYFDDMVLISGISQYPIGTFRIKRLLPVATITESGTVNVWCRFTTNGGVLDTTFNAANILAAISEFPPASANDASSDGVYQRVSGTSNTITIPFANYTLAAGEGVGAVRLEAIAWQSAAGGSNIAASASSGGVSTSLFSSPTATVGTTGQVWVTGIYTPASGWDGTKLNALAMILDSGTDISPLPGYRFIMSEALIRIEEDAGAAVIDLEFDDFQVCSCEPE